MVIRLLTLLFMLLPSPSLSQTCCTHLFLTTTGSAADHQSHRLGSYLLTNKEGSGHPIYKHQNREQFLFFLQSKSVGLWMVGPQVGEYDGGLAIPADDNCVEDVPVGGWRYTDGSAWYQDSLLRLTCDRDKDSKFSETEINAKFKITSLQWNEKLSDPNSESYKELANTIEDDITDMLKSDEELDDQAEFYVSVQNFKKGSVVVDFKVNYVIKEAYIAIPFEIKPSNILKSLNESFQFQKGILFQRFLVASDSFKSSSPVDHCSVKGCSHKCDYDYDEEEYVCTCPRDLIIHSDGLHCVIDHVDEDDVDYGGEFTTQTSEDEFDLILTLTEVLTTTERNTDSEEEITTGATTEMNLNIQEVTNDAKERNNTDFGENLDETQTSKFEDVTDTTISMREIMSTSTVINNLDTISGITTNTVLPEEISKEVTTMITILTETEGTRSDTMSDTTTSRLDIEETTFTTEKGTSAFEDNQISTESFLIDTSERPMEDEPGTATSLPIEITDTSTIPDFTSTSPY